MDAVVARNVSKTFGGKRPVTALADVSLAIREGEIYGLLGPNGAGKTTLIAILIGLTTPDRGTVEVCGLDLRSHLHEVQHQVNLVRGFSGVLEKFTTWELLTYYALLYGMPRVRVEEVMALAGITGKRDAQVSLLLQRLAPALLHRQGDHQPAQGPVHGRAHRGPGRGRGPGGARHHPRPEPGRLHHPADHPLHARGRGAVRPDRPDLRGPDRGRRHRRRSSRRRSRRRRPSSSRAGWTRPCASAWRGSRGCWGWPRTRPPAGCWCATTGPCARCCEALLDGAARRLDSVSFDEPSLEDVFLKLTQHGLEHGR